MVTTNYSVPSPVTANVYSNSTFLNDNLTDDVYNFELNGTKSINLNLHNITTGDDADLYLYQDNGDDVFDPMQDQELVRSRLEVMLMTQLTILLNLVLTLPESSVMLLVAKVV